MKKKLSKKFKKYDTKSIKETKSNFKKEFNKQLLTAISAAFAFLIALSWREPISELLNKLLEPLGETQTIVLKFVGALLLTFVAVIILMFLTRKLKSDD